MNHFYKLWHDAEKGKNSYNHIEAHWSEVPGRDEKWKQETLLTHQSNSSNKNLSVTSLVLQVLLLQSMLN
jgi:hypothetical protein